MNTVTAAVKSSWLSKINWTVAATLLFNVLMLLGHPVPPDVQTSVLSVGNGIGLIAIWVQRTWFTTTVTTASAPKT